MDAGPEGAVKYVCCVYYEYPDSDFDSFVLNGPCDKYRRVAQRVNQRFERIRHGPRRIWVDDKDLSQCRNHFVVSSMIMRVKNMIKRVWNGRKFLQGVLPTLHAPVFALLDINDQEASETASFGSSRTSPLLLLPDF